MPTYASGNNDKIFRATLLQRWATFSVGAADHGDFQVGNIFAFFAGSAKMDRLVENGGGRVMMDPPQKNEWEAFTSAARDNPEGILTQQLGTI